MQRVLVTGATGFIGAAVACALARRGVEVAVLLRSSSDPWRLGSDVRNMHLLHGSLDDAASYAPGLHDFRPDTVMHLGWHGVSKAGRHDPAQVRTNVCGSVDLLLAAAAAGCRTFIGAGSQAEYGPSDAAIDEHHPCCPRSLYGAAKLAAFTLLDQLARQHGMRLAWLRIFSVYGPQDAPDTLVSSLVSQLLAGIRPALTTAEQVWDFLYVDDAAEAFVAVGSAAAAAGVFNVGSGSARPLRETIAQVRDLIDPSLPLGFGEIPSAAHAVRHLEPVVSHLRSVTGWSATTPLAVGLACTIDWHRQVAAGCVPRFSAAS
jgi:UDP-glucose 4-epimerase